MNQTRKIAFVDDAGMFHCPCGAKHGRGPAEPGSDIWRCKFCGKPALKGRAGK